MELTEIRDRLNRALPLRVPQWDPNMGGRDRIEKLTEHLLTCAYHRAELEEALHWTIEAGKRLRDQWNGIEGAEAAVRSSRPTKEQLDAERRRINPEVWTALEECRTLVESLKRQITRLGGTDYDAVSRAYTLLSGP